MTSPAQPLFTRLSDSAYLKQLSKADDGPLFGVVDANREWLGRWLGFIPETQSVEDVTRFIETTLSAAERGAFTWGIYLDDELVGVIGVNRLIEASACAEIGYWLAEKATGRGLMTHACRAALDHLFSTGLINRIELQAAVGNSASSRIAERLGFELEGVRRQGQRVKGQYLDMAFYAMLAEDWLERGKL